VRHVSGRNGAHAVRSTRTVAQQPTIVQKAVSRALAFAMPNLPRASHRLLLALRYYPHRVSRHRSPLHGQLVPQDPPSVCIPTNRFCTINTYVDCCSQCCFFRQEINKLVSVVNLEKTIPILLSRLKTPSCYWLRP
jgi:hypothetical protein